MKTLNWLACFGASSVLLAAGLSRAAEPIEVKRAPTTAPATQPAAASVDDLVAQLGDEKFAKREEAAEALKKLGKDALPALEKASTSTDPQIRTSAQGLVGQITGATDYKPPATPDEFNRRLLRIPRQIQVRNFAGGGVRVTSRVQLNMVVNGQITRDMTVDENGRKVHIHEDADGILVEVTENGQTKESKAKNAAELKTNDPAASKLYENYSGQGPGAIRIEPVRP